MIDTLLRLCNLKLQSRHGMSRSAAARRGFDVPRSTLSYHIIPREYSIVGAGAPTILSPAEKQIVITLQVLQEIGFGMNKELVRVVIHNYLKDQRT